MKKSINLSKIELLAPAGSLEKMKYAIAYGADAVYAGLPDVSMRARINNFSTKDLEEATKYVHKKGKKIFITLNIYAHNYHLSKIEKHLKFLKKINVDAVIVSDPGILYLVKKYLPNVSIHLSTQANVTNWQAAKFWFEQGVERIVLAREVTLEDIKKIKKNVPKLELEYFVHGAMCMSYSGRCILSKWMSGKSANLGDCTQPCRWAYKNKTEVEEYKVMEIEEVQKRHNLELEEDSHGTYFFNSKDLNLINHLDKLKKAGVTSFKIEGRNKSAFYVSNAVRAYRWALDAIESKKTAQEKGKIIKKASLELDKLVNRGYTEGFLLENEPEHNFLGKNMGDSFQFVGEILKISEKMLTIKAHNVLEVKNKIEIVTPHKNVSTKIIKIFNDEMEEVSSAHGGHSKLYHIEITRNDIEEFSLIRKINK